MAHPLMARPLMARPLMARPLMAHPLMAHPLMARRRSQAILRWCRCYTRPARQSTKRR
jgi:hypothetical protein